MKLKDWLKQYRARNGYTLQDLADICGYSKSYISSLEKGINPSTNKPYTVTLDTAKKIAAASGRTVEELAAEVDDVNLPDGFCSVNSDEEKILSGYRSLNLPNRQIFRQILTNFLTAQSVSGATTGN